MAHRQNTVCGRRTTEKKRSHRREHEARAQGIPYIRDPTLHRGVFSPIAPIRGIVGTLAGCLWGTGFFFGRLALNEMNVESMVLYRFFFASLGILPVAIASRERFSASEFRTLLVSAFFGIPVQFLIQFHGLALTTVSHASLMVGSMPVLLGVAAAMFAGERLDAIGWGALVASTIGAALIVLGGHHGTSVRNGPSLEGDLLVVLSLCTALAWILLSKKLMLTHSAPVVSAYTILSGTVMLTIWIIGPTLANPWLVHKVPPPPLHHISSTAWTALAIGGLACTATTTVLWNWGIHHVPASRAGVFLNIEAPGPVCVGRRRPHSGCRNHIDHERTRCSARPRSRIVPPARNETKVAGRSHRSSIADSIQPMNNQVFQEGSWPTLPRTQALWPASRQWTTSTRYWSIRSMRLTSS
jgi:drug/metabolite transporter (DMT)-like permease